MELIRKKILKIHGTAAIIAGTFFSTGALPWVLPYVAQALPLTPMLVAMREVANAGQPLWTTWPELAILGGWVLASGVAAIRVFKFN